MSVFFFLFLVWYDKHFNISNLLKKNQTKTQALDDEELGDSEVWHTAKAG